MVALYASVFAFIVLMFDYLNYTYPDALSYYSSDPYAGGVSYEMAILIVLFPIFLVLTTIIRRMAAADPSRREIWVRRWATYLTLFIAGAGMAADLVTLIMYFLNGDVTMRFLLKVALLLLVAAGIFMHFLADQWGFWEKFPKRARTVGWASALLIVLTIASGFLIVGTPWQARLYRYDEERVSDLQTIQSQIISYWQSKQALPKQLSDLQDPISGYIVPSDPQTNVPFEYKATGATSFELCATFSAETQSNPSPIYAVPVAAPGGIGSRPDNWYHSAGRTCFERTIDPQLYPPFSKTH